MRVDGVITNDKYIILETWTKHYKALAQPNDKPHFDNSFKQIIDENIKEKYKFQKPKRHLW